MHFGSHNIQKQYAMPDYSANDHSLNVTVSEKDLGIWFDPSLKFSVHVTHVVNKAFQNIEKSFISKLTTLPHHSTHHLATPPHLRFKILF